MKSLVLIYLFILMKTILTSENLFPLTIIHLNDMHARFEETNMASNICKENDKCIGGYARVVTKVKELRAKNPNSIYLNAGDNFQGTYWYNLFRWNVSQYFLNLEPADAMTLGNHEFDDGITGLMPFLERIKIPVVSCNIDASQEADFSRRFNSSVILERKGRKIGIIGVTTTFPSNWGKARVLPEVENVRKQVDKLVEQGIKIIIVLSHSGIEIDKEIAKHGGLIDIIVGGHTHLYMFSPNNTGPVIEYPTIGTQENGRNVLIVHASAYTKYLGNIQLFFDEDGEVKRFEGSPIFLSNDVPQHPFILEELKPWKAKVDAILNQTIGYVDYEYDSHCFECECGMGSLVADSMTYTISDVGWTGALIALLLPGSVRAGLSPGKVTLSDLFATTPLGNKLISMELPGFAIEEALELSISKNAVLQMSGLKVVYDLNKKPFEKIRNLKVFCQKCNASQYVDIVSDKYYRIVVTEYLANGIGNFTMFMKYGRNITVETSDIDALVDYVKVHSPIKTPPLMDRIQFL